MAAVDAAVRPHSPLRSTVYMYAASRNTCTERSLGAVVRNLTSLTGASPTPAITYKSHAIPHTFYTYVHEHILTVSQTWALVMVSYCERAIQVVSRYGSPRGTGVALAC